MNPSRADNSLRYGLAAVALWSTVATAFKLSLNHLSVIEMLWVASLASWLFLGVTVWILGEWRGWSSLPPRTIAFAILMGLINPTLYYLMLFAAYQRLPAQEAMAINYSWALTLALLAGPVLKQRLNAGQWLAAGLSYFGVVVIATRGDPLSLAFDNALGVLLALASTVVWSVYWLFNTRLDTPAVSGLFFNFCGGVLAATLLMATTEPRGLPLPGLAWGVYIGLFEMGASFVLWLTAMRRSRNALRTGSLIFLSPPVSLLLIWWLVGEPIGAATLIGLALILLGLALQQRSAAVATDAVEPSTAHDNAAP